MIHFKEERQAIKIWFGINRPKAFWKKNSTSAIKKRTFCACPAENG